MSQQTRDGVAMRLDACETLSSAAAVLRLQEQLFDLLARGLPMTVTIAGLQGEWSPEVAFVRTCKVLQRALLDSGSPTGAIAIALDAAHLSPQFAWMVRCAILGPGSCYLLLGSEMSRPHPDPRQRRRQDRFWLQCWHLRRCGGFKVAFAPSVTSGCPLFSAESADGLLPPYGLQVPPGTAWAVEQLNVVDFAGAQGEVSEFALRERLQRCIEIGDSVHDEADWPTAAMRHDSWSNRRLAICITGIGDLVKRRGADPQSLAALRGLDAVMQLIRETVDDHSRQLAAATEHAPALNIAEAHGSGSAALAAWRTRWQAALQFAATRHRNLLTIPPWSVFPSGESADFRYCDLLPILVYADSCTVPRLPCLQHWNVNEFKHFHQRACAILERRDSVQMIAEQV
jgi:hypothetical protein